MAPNNFVSIWGNEKTMNLNSLVLANIQASPYFKVQLYEIKTYHGVIDEIYYRVAHMEPWERGSRRTAGQTGMCGGTLHGSASVRGVGAGGIVSSCFCLLYKLLTLKLTRKQILGLMNHSDSPYIRGLGFMYIRFTQAPQDLWAWYEDYLDDEEEIDVKAGGGCMMTIGQMLRQWLTKLDWFATLFPRIPVPIQKDIEMKMNAYELKHRRAVVAPPVPAPSQDTTDEVSFGEAERYSHRGPSPRRSSPHRRRHSPHRSSPPRSSNSHKSHTDDFSRELNRERDRQSGSNSREHSVNKSREHKSRDHHSKSHDHHSKSHGHHRSSHKHKKPRRSRSRERHHRSRSTSRDRKH